MVEVCPVGRNCELTIICVFSCDGGPIKPICCVPNIVEVIVSVIV